MAKGQKRSTREIRKSKAARPKAAPVALLHAPVSALSQPPKTRR
jgi:hypothetical protein